MRSVRLAKVLCRGCHRDHPGESDERGTNLISDERDQIEDQGENYTAKRPVADSKLCAVSAILWRSATRT